MFEAIAVHPIRLAAMPKTERGASAVEYGLLVALIAIAIIVAITALGGKLSGVFNKTTSSLTVLIDSASVVVTCTWRPPTHFWVAA